MRIRAVWIDSFPVDAFLFIAPVLLVPMGHFVHVNEGLTVFVVAAVVKFGLDLPHLCSCWTRTLLDPTFRKDHPLQIYFVVPLIVALCFYAGTLGLVGVLVLLNFFTSLPHGFMQVANLQGCYRQKSGEGERPRAVGETLALAMIPTAFIFDRFLGPLPRDLLGVEIPVFWLRPWMVGASWLLGLGGLALALGYEIKALRERRAVNPIKWAFFASVILGYWLAAQIPSVALALLGYLAWHSAQYIVMTFRVNRYRYKEMREKSMLLFSVARPNQWGFYGLMLLFHGLLVYLAMSVLPRFTPNLENAKVVWSFAVLYTLTFSHIFLDVTLMTSRKYSLATIQARSREAPAV